MCEQLGGKEREEREEKKRKRYVPGQRKAWAAEKAFSAGGRVGVNHLSDEGDFWAREDPVFTGVGWLQIQ